MLTFLAEKKAFQTQRRLHLIQLNKTFEYRKYEDQLNVASKLPLESCELSDQMARLFFDIWPFTKRKFAQ